MNINHYAMLKKLGVFASAVELGKTDAERVCKPTAATAIEGVEELALQRVYWRPL